MEPSHPIGASPPTSTPKGIELASRKNPLHGIPGTHGKGDNAPIAILICLDNASWATGS